MSEFKQVTRYKADIQINYMILYIRNKDEKFDSI